MNYETLMARDITTMLINKVIESGRECHVDYVTDRWTTDVGSLVDDVFAVNEAVLQTRYVDSQEYAGWVLLIPSNGEDVISDYSLSIEAIVGPLISQLEVM